MELPEFKLTLVRTEPLPVLEGGPGPQAAGSPGLDGTPGQKDWAYVLHTSGTTGPPKTVRVPHECILPNILHLRSVGAGGLWLFCRTPLLSFCSETAFLSSQIFVSDQP